MFLINFKSVQKKDTPKGMRAEIAVYEKDFFSYNNFYNALLQKNETNIDKNINSFWHTTLIFPTA